MKVNDQTALKFKSWFRKSGSTTPAKCLRGRDICCPDKLPANVINNVLSQHAWLDKSAKQTSPSVFIIQTRHAATVPECSRWGEQQMWCRSHPESPPCWTKPRNTGKPPGSRSSWWRVKRERDDGGEKTWREAAGKHENSSKEG